MKCLVIVILFFSLLSSSFIYSQPHNLKPLVLVITGIRNANGEININIYNKAGGFPKDPAKSLKHFRGKIENGLCTIKIDDLSYGTYAVAIFHDENNNYKIDKAWYGVPTEGIAISNNAQGSISGPPSFDDAKFNFNVQNNSISIRMNYSFTE
jgi:uncharacterized protein (DUF2141 family)